MEALVSEETAVHAVSVGKCEISNLGEVFSLILPAMKLKANNNAYFLPQTFKVVEIYEKYKTFLLCVR